MANLIACAVYGCTNSLSTNTDPTVQYYYFPKYPLIAQQWITACWRADPIDLDTARICSIHFDTDSYTSEYKLLDYLGNYTRVLKYDAVPTLYLPNPHTPVIIKANIEPIAAAPESINPHDIKEIMVYEVQNVSGHTSNSNFETAPVKDYIEIESREPLSINSNLKFDEPNQVQQVNESFKHNKVTAPPDKQNDEKYRHISNKQQLETLKSENVNLRQKIEKLESVLKKIEAQATEKHEALKTKDEDLKKLMQQYDTLHRASMTIIDQKNILSKVFSESQIKILSGKKKIYWSNDDMAMGYTIRHLSNKRCYMYLSKNLNIPLPALSSIKRWSTLKKNEFEKEETKANNKFEDEDSE